MIKSRQKNSVFAEISFEFQYFFQNLEKFSMIGLMNQINVLNLLRLNDFLSKEYLNLIMFVVLFMAGLAGKLLIV